MSRCRSLVYAGSTGLAAVLAAVCSASAAPPIIPAVTVGSQVQPAGYACNAYSCWHYGLYYNPVYRPYLNYYPPYGAPVYGPYAYRPYYMYPSYGYRPYALYYPPYAPYYRPAAPFYPYRQYYRVYQTPYYAPYGNNW